MYKIKMNLTKPRDGAIAWETDEIQRVLSMGIPVVVKVAMPRAGSLMSIHHHGTDLLIYFPAPHCYEIYLTGWDENNKSIHTLLARHYNSSYIGQALRHRNGPYKYCVELPPFIMCNGLEGMPFNEELSFDRDSFIGEFHIPYTIVGADMIRLLVHYRRDARKDEKMVIEALHGVGNEYHYHHRKCDERHVATLNRRDGKLKENEYYLYWIPDDGEGNSRRLPYEFPTIQGYHPDDKEEWIIEDEEAALKERYEKEQKAFKELDDWLLANHPERTVNELTTIKSPHLMVIPGCNCDKPEGVVDGDCHHHILKIPEPLWKTLHENEFLPRADKCMNLNSWSDEIKKELQILLPA